VLSSLLHHDAAIAYSSCSNCLFIMQQRTTYALSDTSAREKGLQGTVRLQILQDKSRFSFRNPYFFRTFAPLYINKV